MKGGGTDERFNSAAAEARMAPGDLLPGVNIALFFPLSGDSASDPNDSLLRNGGRKFGIRCCCEDGVCEGAGLLECDGAGDLGSPAMEARILSNMMAG